MVSEWRGFLYRRAIGMKDFGERLSRARNDVTKPLVFVIYGKQDSPGFIMYNPGLYLLTVHRHR